LVVLLFFGMSAVFGGGGEGEDICGKGWGSRLMTAYSKHRNTNKNKK
jgi:hypothetical protein